MAWSYDTSLTTTRDRVRFLIGDTDTNDQQLSNEEISFVLSDNSDKVYAAAVECVRALRAKFARLVDRSVGDLKNSYSQRQKAYEDLETALQKKATGNIASIMAGAVYESTSEADRTDSTILQPFFKRDQFRNPRSSTLAPDSES